MRGAGANFGVVVSATYKLQPQVNNGQLLVADILVPAEKAAAYFNLLQSYDGGRLPQHLSISSFMSWNATINDVSRSVAITMHMKGHEALNYGFRTPTYKPVVTTYGLLGLPRSGR